PVAKRKRFVQGEDSLEISVRVVQPHSVSELESLMRFFLPRAQANISLSWIYVWVVNFCPASIPDLVGFLDLMPSHEEADMPKSNDGRVDRIIGRGCCGFVLHRRL